MRTAIILIAVALSGAGVAPAQQSHEHAATHDSPSMPTQAGEAAYGTIAEIVQILEKDPATDWSRVDLEELRKHLADMHEVTINAAVTQTQIAGGLLAVVTGSGRTIGAIKRMANAHARASAGTPYAAEVAETEDGVRLRLIAESGNARDVQKIRGLGFIGWLTLDDHHSAHHLMMARSGKH